MFFEEEGGHQNSAGTICPLGLGVEEKGDRPQTGQDCSGSAWTPLLRPIYLCSPVFHHIIKKGKKPELDRGGHAALWVTRTRSWPGRGAILNPSPKLPPQPAWLISGYKGTAPLPATSSSPLRDPLGWCWVQCALGKPCSLRALVCHWHQGLSPSPLPSPLRHPLLPTQGPR